MVVHRRDLQHPFLPIDILHVTVILGRTSVQPVGIGFQVAFTALIGVDFELQLHEFVGIHQVHAVGGVLQAERALVAHLRTPGMAAARGDHDYAVRTPGSVDRRGRSVLQHVDRHDVRGIQRRGVETFERKSIDHVERRTVLRQGVLAADDDVDRRAGFAFARSDLHAGDTSCKRLVERTYGGFLHLFGVDRGDRSGQIDATHIAVAHDDHLVDLAGILGERHVEHGALADAQLLRDVSQHGEDQFGVIVFDPDRVFAFGVRRRAALRSLFEDRNADQRRARSVLDMAGHLPALLGIGPEAPACRHEPQAQGPYDRHTQSAPSGGAGPMK